MRNKSKKVVNAFKIQKTDLRQIKYKTVMVAFVQKLGYTQNVLGRCISLRVKGKISSIVVRSKQYGIYARVILNNPKLVIMY
jgi:hypothetical protein